MKNVHGRVRKVFTGPSVDVVCLEASTEECGVRTTEEKFGTFGGELERKHSGVDSTRHKGVVKKGELAKKGEGWVRQTHQSKAS